MSEWWWRGYRVCVVSRRVHVVLTVVCVQVLLSDGDDHLGGARVDVCMSMCVCVCPPHSPILPKGEDFNQVIADWIHAQGEYRPT